MSGADGYRALTGAEIEQLKGQRCRAESWEKIRVAEGFDPSFVEGVRFSGSVTIGATGTERRLSDSVRVRSGIYNSALINVEVGNGAYISNIGRHIANYRIGEGCVIDNVEEISCNGRTAFGNNVKVSVINETGGREVPIFDRLSSHLAYFLAIYRHKMGAIEAISGMIEAYAGSVASDCGTVGRGARIVNCGEIRNVRIGEYALIDGASLLAEGTVKSSEEAPATVGRDVIAQRFIICDSTTVSEGVVLDKCFVGQGCRLGKQYSAGDSLFFANCVGMHGEACAVFAGPYTVTHHKSTLLISGMYSFLNAGSGSNQSNHLYKLGPIHQGIAERGCKTSSDSYLLAPFKVGAFSVIMGRHYGHIDTSDMPFSYIIESNDATRLVPGVNIRSVGTIRDAMKWPRRDSRKGKERLDRINFNLLSPFTVSKMIRACKVLTTIREASGRGAETYSYGGTVIKNSSLQQGLKLYEMAIDKFLGNSIIKRLETVRWRDIGQIRERLKPDYAIGLGEWVDVSGLFAPKSEVDLLLEEIASGRVSSLEEIDARFAEMQRNYYDYEWTWAVDRICRRAGKTIDEIGINDIFAIVERWKESVVELDNLFYEDARKEFAIALKTSFGADGDHNDKQEDFNSVRGDLDNNDFVRNVLHHIETKTALAQELLGRIKHIG